MGYILQGFLRRIGDIWRARQYDYVFIHREATPIGPPIVEYVLSRLLRKKIIYDFDDAIWLTSSKDADASGNHTSLLARLKWSSKVAPICRWAHTVVVGNDYLAAFAERQNSNTLIIPTVVNTICGHHLVQNQQTQRVNIGWTGSHTTLGYLTTLVPILAELEQRYDFTFYVIANKNPELPLRSFQFIPWNKATEAEDLLNFHIGVMPLEDNAWAKGKCGFKAIQYMAAGMPALVAPVGVNKEIVEHGVQGYHCTTADDWKTYLVRLLEDSALRQQMGQDARQKIVESYSVEATTSAFLRLFSI